ncbi:hypothetical protein NEUTE1DRAFT_124132 [Neurospora tetrasperma FGSC 2508]|uniref:Uncharacterized protein n=1 Tax=Neurospora tetrasperma (strain FGSC 2508 / ATCC MYA-4615 / P0657) TaxID=510951 RepID=F8MRT1_NEUT8|nr:uncharacterized protein NEUTE1DRAFT_124132 [Neurospora tetrasperma FGSC 2508]EGO55777.1 hypothetical protein NEUTE1DRAFT_124132 [Neurospora tetrasperma FGSC 2508]
MATRNLLNFSLSLVFHVSMAVASSSSSSAQLTLTIGSPSNPPFGLPPSDFALAIAHPVSNASFPTTGYNTSIPAGPADATGSEVPGWYLSISVAANIPLTNASDTSSSSISAKDKKSKFTEAAVLSLVPPSTHRQEGLDAESWRVCAIVFTGGLSDETTETAQTARLDGTCAALLPKIDSSNFDQSNRRYSFFAGASAPAGKDNASALVAMERVPRRMQEWAGESLCGL